MARQVPRPGEGVARGGARLRDGGGGVREGPRAQAREDGPPFREAYAGLADVAYLQRDDLASALALYDRAAANGYVTADTSYKTGNILYRSGRYQESLERFFQAGAEGATSPYLDYAFGSALYARDDLFSAEAYYRKASAAMEKSWPTSGTPLPRRNPPRSIS